MLEIKDLSVAFEQNNKLQPVLHKLSYTLKDGEVLAIVGESGCGKTIHALAIMGLLPINAKITKGQILFDDKNILTLPPKEKRALCGKQLALVFQDALTSLNPVLTVKEHLFETLTSSLKISKQDALTKTIHLLKQVELDPKILSSYPHQLSGGQRQRVLIALALALNPKILIADEPTTALDSATQKQILQLLKKLQKERELSVIFITHNLSAVKEFAERVLVLYGGIKVEEGPVNEIFNLPKHPYTQGLLNSLITKDTPKTPLTEISGTPPKAGEVFRGCNFATRCSRAQKICFTQKPVLKEIVDKHFTTCLLAKVGLKCP